MILVSLLPALLLSSKLKFHLLQSPYFLSLPSLSPLPFSFSPEISTYFFPFVAVKTSLFLFFLSEIYLSHVGINFSFIILELFSVLYAWVRVYSGSQSKMFINIWWGQHIYMTTPGASKKKCRQYSVEYLKYGFIESPNNPQQPMCLVCEKNFSNEAMKLSRLLEHLQKIQPDKYGKTLAFFYSLWDQFLKRKTINMFTSSSKNSDDGLKVSYNISLLIAKAGKPHTIGEELILPAVKEVIKTVLQKSPEQVIKSIPLSDNSVQRKRRRDPQ